MHTTPWPSQPERRAAAAGSVHYERHRPERTTLYRLVQQHAASFIAHTEASTGSELPGFIKDEFDAFLECGILAHGYQPHHERLASLTNSTINGQGKVLVIDAHSFPSRPLPYEQDQEKDRPEICIGTGARVPQEVYRTDRRANAVMVEVRRDLYLDEASGMPNENFHQVSEHISNCLDTALKAWH